MLRAVRKTIRAAAPKAEERISYRMPSLFQDGAVVYYAAFKQHIGLFPPVADPRVRARVARYAGPKGNLQFPLSEPMPHALIAAVVKARLKENSERAAAKGHKGKSAASARRGKRAPGEDDYRRIALALTGVVEGAHMGHADFRVNNRVFASLHNGRGAGAIMLTPEQQADVMREHPDAFTPASGAWGRSGWTTVRLAGVAEEALGEALTRKTAADVMHVDEAVHMVEAIRRRPGGAQALVQSRAEDFSDLRDELDGAAAKSVLVTPRFANLPCQTRFHQPHATKSGTNHR